MIAAATLILVEEGKLRLYDPVDAWLPELAHRFVLRDPDGSLDDVYPASRSITLHDLLTSRLGIGWGASRLLAPRIMALMPTPVAEGLGIEQAENLDPSAWMAHLGEFPLLANPGERFYYHVAFDILGVLIARVSGQALEVFLRERLFEPLKMSDTGFVVSAEKLDRFATLYARAGARELTVRDHPRSTGWAYPPLFPSAGAGLVSTADDFQRFGRMLLNKGELDGVRILSRKAVEAMTTDYLTPEQHAQPYPFPLRADADRSEMWINQGFGYGVAVRTRQIGLGPSVGAFFWPGAFGTTWIADPKEHLVATLLTQIVDPDPFYPPITEDFLTLTYQAISD